MHQINPKTVSELIDHFLQWAETYYRRDDDERSSTGHAGNLASSLSHFRVIAGSKAPHDVSADDICYLQEYMQAIRRPKRLSREYINRCCNHVRQMYKWAAKPPRRWVSVTILHDMQLAEGLKAGRCDAVELPDVPPVSESDYLATMNRLATYSYSLRDARRGMLLSCALDILWHSGMRPGELMNMRNDPAMFSVTQQQLHYYDESVEIMVYHPRTHKTKHHGFDRNIFLSPSCRVQIDRCRAQVPCGDRLFPWTTSSLREALYRVQRRCSEFRHDGKTVAAEPLVEWFPLQLRHAFATRMRRLAGIDVLQVLMGHRNRSTTEIYAAPDATAAIAAILQFG